MNVGLCQPSVVLGGHIKSPQVMLDLLHGDPKNHGNRGRDTLDRGLYFRLRGSFSADSIFRCCDGSRPRMCH
jgi:hypothetical protein